MEQGKESCEIKLVRIGNEIMDRGINIIAHKGNSPPCEHNYKIRILAISLFPSWNLLWVRACIRLSRASIINLNSNYSTHVCE